MYANFKFLPLKWWEPLCGSAKGCATKIVLVQKFRTFEIIQIY